MTTLLVLVPVSIGMGLIGLGAFIWAMGHQQFDDLEGNAWRVIGPMETEDGKGRPDDGMAPHAEDSDSAGRL
jgi:cbb3-type cytochrome oxidase maturation protein